MSKINLALLVFYLLVVPTTAQNAEETKPTVKRKTGWSLGAVPAVAFDSDIGFKYGAVANFYDYGNGSIYPGYKHSIFIEWSRTTKGSGINSFRYDSEYLIPNIRTSGEFSYLTEKGLDFFGFNGYKAFYDASFTDDSPLNAEYRSRMYFKQNRELFRARLDFQGALYKNKLRWIAGFEHYTIKLDTVDITALNKGKKESDLLPAVGGGLYGHYLDWELLPEEEAKGGTASIFKFGVVYDTRDNEPMPMKGVWSEALLFVAPGIFGKRDPVFTKFSLIHRQYFTLAPNRMSFVYRLGYQGKLTGGTPSYLLPILFNYGRLPDRDGLGGSKNLRGVLRNRVVGEDMAYANFEWRWKFINRVIFSQNIYIALSLFSDLGMVTRDYEISTDNVPSEYLFLFPETRERLHQSIGSGIHIALNENFVVAFDFGKAIDKRDGNSGLYINLNWLF